MLIWQKKSWLFTILVLIILFLLLLTIDKQKLSEERANITQTILSLNLGISSFHNLVDSGEYRAHTINEKIISVISAIPKIINYKLFGINEFERIGININFTDYLTLMKDRERAIKNQLLFDPIEVNGTIDYMGKTYKAEVRLKGDLYDHWESKNRVSLRVKLKNDKTILGFSAFSIQKPRTRAHPYDYTFQSLVREAGNISPVHKFAYVIVNGERWGVMDIEEHISKELLEKQNRKESIIVRFSNRDKFFYNLRSKIPYEGYRLSDPLIYAHLYSKKSSKGDPHKRKMYSYIVKNRLLDNDIYDTDSFSKALIMSLVWNNLHTLASPNSRYYFNPYTLKLEPITTDQSEWFEIQNDNILNSDRFTSNNAEIYLNILKDEFFLDRLPKNLEIVTKSVSNINDHLLRVQSLFPVDKKISAKIIEDNMKRILNNKEKHLINPVHNIVAKNKIKRENKAIKLPRILPTKEQASEFTQHLYIKHYANGTLEIYNLISDNITINSILYNGTSFINKDMIIPSYITNSNPTTINTEYKGIQDNMFEVNSQYQGFSSSTKNDITLISKGTENPLLLDTADEFNFIERLNEKKYEFKQGSWTINKPIIVEGDLHISPGTNLRFAKNAYIIIKGSLTAIGDDSNPIILDAVSDSWKGVYVLNAGKKSHLKNVNISNISSLEDGLLKLTGGITFYKSDVDIENVRIKNVEAEDAINIVESAFSLNSVFIDNTISDGFDSDFSSGSITHSNLSNIGGDALDFSGSNVSIVNTKASNVKDKAVSAGEKSDLNIENSQFINIGIGLASKDGSVVNTSNTSILDYKLYGVMSYIKKDFYGSPKINISNSTVSSGNDYVRQKGTSMTVDGIEILESEINVEKLYKLEK